MVPLVRCAGPLGRVFWALAVACSPREAPLANKACPCADSQVCDEAENRCVPFVLVPPTSIAVTRGAATNLSVPVRISGTATANVILEGLPAGVSASPRSAFVTASAAAATWTLHADAGAVAGSYVATIVAEGGRTLRRPLTLNVAGAPGTLDERFHGEEAVLYEGSLPRWQRQGILEAGEDALLVWASADVSQIERECRVMRVTLEGRRDPSFSLREVKHCDVFGKAGPFFFSVGRDPVGDLIVQTFDQAGAPVRQTERTRTPRMLVRIVTLAREVHGGSLLVVSLQTGDATEAYALLKVGAEGPDANAGMPVMLEAGPSVNEIFETAAGEWVVAASTARRPPQSVFMVVGTDGRVQRRGTSMPFSIHGFTAFDGERIGVALQPGVDTGCLVSTVLPSDFTLAPPVPIPGARNCGDLERLADGSLYVAGSAADVPQTILFRLRADNLFDPGFGERGRAFFLGAGDLPVGVFLATRKGYGPHVLVRDDAAQRLFLVRFWP